eukprot:NODE_801_length_4112_cov_0.079990.p1 type:complete len:396 gc:universal NODE_801_length_4112_cov_0.079990:2579-3766(+)
MDTDHLADTFEDINIQAHHFKADDLDIKVDLFDPNSTLYSVTKFEELNIQPDILKGIYACKFIKPSRIQENALPLLLTEPYRNLIAQSQSGTGKTAAFTICCLSRVDRNLPEPQAVILAPARELAKQIKEVIDEIGQFTGIQVEAAVREELESSGICTAQIVVGTPGTILHWIKTRRLTTNHIRVMVLDEADNMLAGQSMSQQAIRIKNMLIKNRPQICLFSATYPNDVREFALQFAPESNRITLQEEELKVDAIKQFYIEVSEFANLHPEIFPEYHPRISNEVKNKLLEDIYGLLTVGQSIIFVQTKRTADEVVAKMSQEGHSCCCLHGGLGPNDRDTIMSEFRNGTAKVLIATNVLSRGIDVIGVNLVINYDLPVVRVDDEYLPDYETYGICN